MKSMIKLIARALRYAGLVAVLIFELCNTGYGVSYLQSLQTIRAAGDSCPNVALDSLYALRKKKRAHTQYGVMKERLLHIRLRDKSHTGQATVDSVRSVYDYVMRRDDLNDKVEASYYLAKACCNELGDSIVAVDYLMSSLVLARQSEKPDTVLTNQVYSQLARIYGKKSNGLERTDSAMARYYAYRRLAGKESMAMFGGRNEDMITGLFLCAVVAVQFFAFMFYKEKKALAELLSVQKVADASKELVSQRTEELGEKMLCLESMEKRMSEMGDRLKGMENELKMRMAQNVQLMRAAYMERAAEADGGIILKFKLAAVGKCNVEASDWKGLFAAVNALYPGFDTDIQARMHRISEPLLRVCYLLKIGMGNPQIERVTGYPHQTVWRRVKKVTEIMGGSQLSVSALPIPSQTGMVSLDCTKECERTKK